MSFKEQKLLIWMKSNLPIYFFADPIFSVFSLPSSNSQKYSTRSFIVLVCICKFILYWYFELFLYMMQNMDLSLFFAYGYQTVATSFIENAIPFPLNCFCIFVENPLSKCIWVGFWTLFSSTDLISYMNTILQIYSNSKSGCESLPSLLFFFKFILAVSGPVWFHMEASKLAQFMSCSIYYGVRAGGTVFLTKRKLKAEPNHNKKF